MTRLWREQSCCPTHAYAEFVIVTDRNLQSSRITCGLVAALVTLYVAARVAWMSDDGLINIRTALNFSVGSGPVFNPGERVQGYTSPLWFWIQASTGLITQDFIITSIILNLLFAAMALFVLGYQTANLTRLLPVIVIVFLSSTVHDYATSGLENSLAMLVVVLLLRAVEAHTIGNTARFSASVSLLSSLLILTRFDYILLLPPLMTALYLTLRSRSSLFALMGGALPLLVWLGFSVYYYGQILPNTYYAKLNVDIPRSEQLIAGLRYLVVSIELDPMLLMAFLSAFVVVILSKNLRTRLIFVASLAYVAYVCWIGGDFMAGRFLTTPMIIWLWIIGATPLQQITHPLLNTAHAFRNFAFAVSLVSISIALPGAFTARPTYNSPERMSFNDTGGIADEASYYRARGSSLIGVLLEFGAPSEFATYDAFLENPEYERLSDLVLRQTKWFKHEPFLDGSDQKVLVACGQLGNQGLAVGPSVHIIDPCGLVDPFLSRIPYQASNFQWRVGHFARPIPDGYLDAVKFNDAGRVVDENLRVLLRNLWGEVRGDSD